MQNNFKKSSDSTVSVSSIKQISLVIIRLEIDTDDKENSRNDFIHSLFKYESPAYLNKQLTLRESSLEEYSEKSKINKKDLLKLFVGKRQSHLIRIETYDFAHDMKNSSASVSRNVVNSMTMQDALQTAYSEWNKEKISAGINCANDATNSISEKAGNKDTYILKKDKEIHSQKPEDSKLDQQQMKNIEKDSQKSIIDPKEDLIEPEDADLIHKLNDPLRSSKMNETSETTIKSLSKKINTKKGIKHQAKKENDIEEKVEHSLIRHFDSKMTEISFYYGNPTVEIVKGFLHIYKDTNLIPLIEDESAKREMSTVSTLPTTRSEMLCMIGIPAKVNCNELLDFIMPFNETIEYMRIVRDNSPNQYMALIKLKTEKDTDTFYLHYNNRSFNSIEENICHLVFVERIEVMNSNKGASLPIPSFIELPTCYICLERMDESLNGVITILCNHSFHVNCLSEWKDETLCPVCKYTQSPEYYLDNMCSDCGSHENLWICLICGNVGCGRYVRGHAYNHFQLTQHTYSMQMGSNRVWDYAADNYVHRLIQNKTDGKPVQLDESGRAINQDEKIDSITMEYTYLLTNQLESQRSYYEERLQFIEDKYKTQISDSDAKTKQMENENSTLKQNIVQLTKERANLEKKCSTLNVKITKMQSELEEEKELNKCLISNQEVYQNRLSKMEDNLKKLQQEKDAEIDDLKSQLKDIMFYLDAQNKIAECKDVTKEEINQSHLVIQQNATASDVSIRKTKKKK